MQRILVLLLDHHGNFSMSLADLQTLAHPRLSPGTFSLVCVFSLGHRIQNNRFKYYLCYLQMCVSSLTSFLDIRLLYPNGYQTAPLGNLRLKLICLKLNSIFFFKLPVFPILLNGSSIYLVVQAPNLRVILDSSLSYPVSNLSANILRSK